MGFAHQASLEVATGPLRVSAARENAAAAKQEGNKSREHFEPPIERPLDGLPIAGAFVKNKLRLNVVDECGGGDREQGRRESELDDSRVLGMRLRVLPRNDVCAK